MIFESDKEELSEYTNRELAAALGANCDESKGSRLCALIHESSRRLNAAGILGAALGQPPEQKSTEPSIGDGFSRCAAVLMRFTADQRQRVLKALQICFEED